MNQLSVPNPTTVKSDALLPTQADASEFALLDAMAHAADALFSEALPRLMDTKNPMQTITEHYRYANSNDEHERKALASEVTSKIFNAVSNFYSSLKFAKHHAKQGVEDRSKLGDVVQPIEDLHTAILRYRDALDPDSLKHYFDIVRNIKLAAAKPNISQPSMHTAYGVYASYDARTAGIQNMLERLKDLSIPGDQQINNNLGRN